MYFTAKPGQIQYFITHLLYIEEKAYKHTFAFVDWFLPLSDEIKYMYGKPVEVWSADHFELSGEASFIPVQRI